MKRIEVIIDITQKDIDEGLVASMRRGPIGISLLDAGYKNVCVDDSVSITLECDGINYEYYNFNSEDNDIMDFIKEFDSGKYVEPFKTKPLDFIEIDLSYKSNDDI